MAAGAADASPKGRADTPTPDPSPQGGGEREPRKPRRPGAIHASERAEGAARRLRRSLRPGEQRLWKALRKLDLPGGHFRRQAPFGPYVLDFVCHSARLVVEVDGGVHRLAPVAARDLEREAWLRGRGYVVCRVSDHDAYSDSITVVQRIAGLIGADTPTPTPPRKGEGPKIGEE